MEGQNGGRRPTRHPLSLVIDAMVRTAERRLREDHLGEMEGQRARLAERALALRQSRVGNRPRAQ